MMLRWVATDILEAVKGFRRLKGYADMRTLVAALRARDQQLGLSARERWNMSPRGKYSTGIGNKHNRPEPGTKVVLKSVPPGLMDGLPQRGQRAITAIVGQPVRLVDYHDVGRAELDFTDERGDIHYIYVKREYLRPAE